MINHEDDEDEQYLTILNLVDEYMALHNQISTLLNTVKKKVQWDLVRF